MTNHKDERDDYTKFSNSVSLCSGSENGNKKAFWLS